MITERFNSTLVIVDALDECAELLDKRPNRKVFIEALSAVPKLKLFITSRDLPAIRRLLPRASELQIHSNLEDVMSYVDRRIDESDKLKDFIQEKPALKDEIIMAVKEKYSNIFILTRLLMDFIVDLNSIGEVRDNLQSLPTDSKDFYGLSIGRIKQKAESSNLGLRILEWIFHSRRPLRVEELRHALAVRLGKLEAASFTDYKVKEQVLVDHCEGLVVINSETRVMSFAHPTINDYLEQIEVRTRLFPTAQTDISAVCVTYLSFDAFDTGFCLTDEDFEARLLEYTFYDYAARNWGHHARDSSKLIPEVIDFLRKMLIQVHQSKQNT